MRSGVAMIHTPFEATGDPQTAAIIAAAIEVHRVLGRGFVERAYRRPLAFELAERKIPFESEVVFPIEYKGRRTGVVYRLDFVCFGGRRRTEGAPRNQRTRDGADAELSPRLTIEASAPSQFWFFETTSEATPLGRRCARHQVRPYGGRRAVTRRPLGKAANPNRSLSAVSLASSVSSVSSVDHQIFVRSPGGRNILSPSLTPNV